MGGGTSLVASARLWLNWVFVTDVKGTHCSRLGRQRRAEPSKLAEDCVTTYSSYSTVPCITTRVGDYHVSLLFVYSTDMN